jgi:hypothetical protein
MDIVVGWITIDHELIVAIGNRQLVALYAPEWLKGRTGGPPAIRTMTVHGVAKVIRYGITDRPAEARPSKRAAFHVILICHKMPLLAERTFP